MFKKVLVSEDMEDINKAILASLIELGIKETHQAEYCDDAYLKIKKAILDEVPYQLLITDLSFKSDYRQQKFKSGEDLIKTIKQEHPSTKIIVYSIEDRFHKVRTLMNDHNVDAYVCKSRRGLTELSKAIKKVFHNENYLSPEVEEALSNKYNLEIDDYDIQLLTHLSNGLSQDGISNHLKENKISPNSLSAIEKRLNKLRIEFKANNATHLVAIVKDLGLI